MQSVELPNSSNDTDSFITKNYILFIFGLFVMSTNTHNIALHKIERGTNRYSK